MSTAGSLAVSTASLPGALPSPHHARPISVRKEAPGVAKSKSKTEPRIIEYRRSGRIIELPLKSTSWHASPAPPVPEEFPPEHLKVATHIGGGKVSLRFSDGFLATVNLEDLGIDVANLKMGTARPSWGSAVEVEDVKGKPVHIDSAVLRAQCDPKYAAELEHAIMALSTNGSPGKGGPPSGGAQGLRHLSATKQRRLDFLMDKNNEGRLGEAEQQEFQALVREVEQLTIDNARRLAEQK